MSNLEDTRKIRRDELEDTSISPVSPSLEEAVEAIEEAALEAKLPFARWLIKLLVDNATKIVTAAVIPAVTAAATAAGGWYVVGQYQVKDQVKEEVEVRDRVRNLVGDAMAPDDPIPGARGPDGPPISAPATEPTLDELRKRWSDRYDLGSGESDPSQSFPEDLIRQEIMRRGKK